MSTAPKYYSKINALFVFCTFKTIKNDIIACCGDHIRENILTEVRKAKHSQFLPMKYQTYPILSSSA